MSLPGLLLLHGVGDSGDCFGPFVARLREHGDGELAGLAVVTPSANCHGGQRIRPTRTLARADQIAAATEHAVELVARTGRPIVLGGHSMGAAIALATAAGRPDLVAALWLEDPPLMATMKADDARTGMLVDISGFAEWIRPLQEMPLAHVVALVAGGHPQWDVAEFEPWARAKQTVDLAAFAEPVPFLDGWAADARRLECPVVLAHGDPMRGSVVHPTAAAELAERSNWSVHALATGHDVRRDAPEEAVGLLGELIRSV